MDARFRGAIQTVTEDGHGLGCIPPPALHLGPQTRPRVIPLVGQPPACDLRLVPGKLPATSALGAQFTVSLSSAAQVDARVVDIAGRPVKTICRAMDCEAGPHTLLWNAQSDIGLLVPSGIYLIEVVARAPDGPQTRALAQVRIDR